MVLVSNGWFFFVLEAASYGTRIKDIPIQIKQLSKPRHIAWENIIQLFYVLRMLFK